MSVLFVGVVSRYPNYSAGNNNRDATRRHFGIIKIAHDLAHGIMRV